MENGNNTYHKLELALGIVALIAGAGLIVFSCVDFAGSMLAQVIFGLALIVLALIWMILYARHRRGM